MAVFQPGDDVVLSRATPLEELGNVRAEVIDVKSSHLRVSVGSPPVDIAQGAWRVDRVANKTAYSRTLTALRKFADDRQFVGSHAIRSLLVENLEGGSEEIDTEIQYPLAAQVRATSAVLIQWNESLFR